MPKPTHLSSQTAAIIGGGPAGLMAAEIISRAGVKTDVYDAMPSVGRKFLMAGKGGLNITHSEPFLVFLSRYGVSKTYLQPILERFNPEELRNWVHQLGIKTFIGTSGRVFPEEMKAAPLLRAWLHRLRQQGVKFHVRHQWIGWGEGQTQRLRFRTPEGICEIEADAVILALGGGSWPHLGSTGAWVDILLEKGIPLSPLTPSNCGFDLNWSEHFRHRYAGRPLKSVSASFDGMQKHGDCTVTATGIEGGIIYSLSSALRERITTSGSATLHLDLKPDVPLAVLIDRFSKPRGKQSVSNHLRKCLGIGGVKVGLLREILSPDDFGNPTALCSKIKSLPLKLHAARPLAEAISSAGGVRFDAVDNNLMLVFKPGVFCTGEMLDWDAPTGGYLLTACLASGRVTGEGVVKWLKSRANT